MNDYVSIQNIVDYCFECKISDKNEHNFGEKDVENFIFQIYQNLI